ncbi:PAS and ANTAR domain-containing protein [Cellulosimicrobium funkei]|uniref:PAS and ANTAR domain-containing protein n=1 Tax=Cellulosimicrobium funkei TaxID=264251 RepID=UPI003757100D
MGTGTWWWSSETYRVHGFEPGEVVPTTELVLAHKHPDDREHVRAVLDRAAATGEPFSSVHRIMDAHGVERYVALVGQGRRDRETGEVVELMGYFTDITATITSRANERTRRDILAAAEGRGPIEQAKGVLIATHGVSADEAFARLKHASNDKNVRLRDLASVVVDEAMRAGGDCAERIDAILR